MQTVPSSSPASPVASSPAEDVVIDLTDDSWVEPKPTKGADEEEGDEGFVIRGPLDDNNLDLEELGRIEAEMIEVDAALKALDEGIDSLRALTSTATGNGPLAAIAPLLAK